MILVATWSCHSGVYGELSPETHALVENWVGIYKEEQTPGDVDSTDWLYVNGTQEATTGKSSGQLVFDLAVGKYEAFFVRTVVIKS